MHARWLLLFLLLPLPAFARAENERLLQCLLEIEDIAVRAVAQLDHGDWLEREYRLVDGTYWLPDARVILAGDTHTDPRHETLSRRLVERFARPGDWVLVEGAPYEREIRQSRVPFLRDLEARLHVRGWDDREAFEAAVAEITGLVEAALADGSDEELDGRIEAVERTALVRRNRVLRRSLDRALRATDGTRRRIFVFAGSRHLTEHPELPRFFGARPHSTLVPRRSAPPSNRQLTRWIGNLTGLDLSGVFTGP